MSIISRLLVHESAEKDIDSEVNTLEILIQLGENGF